MHETSSHDATPLVWEIVVTRPIVMLLEEDISFLRWQVQGFSGEEKLAEALTGCDLVIIPAGMPRKPGMSRDDLFKVNASIVQVCHTMAVKRLHKCCCMSSLGVWCRCGHSHSCLEENSHAQLYLSWSS